MNRLAGARIFRGGASQGRVTQTKYGRARHSVRAVGRINLSKHVDFSTMWRRARSDAPYLKKRPGALPCSAGFLTCCIAGLPACKTFYPPKLSDLLKHADKEIGDTAGKE